MLKRKELADMTFEEIRKLHGEQAAIEAGIAADADTSELDNEWFKRARPAEEVDPDSMKEPNLGSESPPPVGACRFRVCRKPHGPTNTGRSPNRSPGD